MNDWESRFPIPDGTAVNARDVQYINIEDDEIVDMNIQMHPPPAPSLSSTSEVGSSEQSDTSQQVVLTQPSAAPTPNPSTV